MADKERPIRVESGFPRFGTIVEFAKPAGSWRNERIPDVQRLQLVRVELAKFGAS